MESLQNLAARKTAQYWGCDELESTTVLLDEHLLKKICENAFPDNEKELKCWIDVDVKLQAAWNRVGSLITTGAILKCKQIGFLLAAKVRLWQTIRRCSESEDPVNVCVKFEKQTITHVSCSWCKKDVCCEHILAAILYRLRFHDQVPVYPPMTDTLCRLSRDQLQKLSQFTVQSNTADMILPLSKTIEELRIPKSEISMIRGAVDPTFEGNGGNSRSEEHLWQRVLKGVTIKFKNDFISKKNRFFNDDPVEFYDEYMRQVADLIHNREVNKAGDVLGVLAATVAELDRDRVITPSSSLLIRNADIWMACFILTFDGKARDHLLDVLTDIHSTFRESNDSIVVFTAGVGDLLLLCRSLNIPDQTHTSEAAGKKELNEPNVLFHNSLCAGKCKIVSLDLLQEGKFTSAIREEPIPLMLFRFKSLLQFRRNDMTKYGCLVLRKCMGMEHDMFSGTQYSASLKIEDCEAGPSQPKVRRVNSSSSQSLQSTAGPFGEQMACVILYLCNRMRVQEVNLHNSSNYFVAQCLMAEATLRVANEERNLFSRRFKHLFTIRWDTFISEIQKRLLSKTFLGLFSSVILRHALASDTFYSIHIKNLLMLLTTSEYLPIDWRVELCEQVVCSTLSTDCIVEICSLGVRNDVIVELLSWLSQQHLCVKREEAVTKMLEACLRCKCRKTSQFVLNVLRKQTLIVNYNHSALVLRLLLHHVPRGDYNREKKEELFDEILWFGETIGSQFPVIVFPKWEILSETLDRLRLAKILNAISHSLNPPLPSDVTDALMTYFRAECHHDVECIDFIRSTPNGQIKTMAYEAVYLNSNHYSCQVLFQVAKMAEEDNSSLPLPVSDILSEHGYQLLRKAFDRYQNSANDIILSGSSIPDVLNWFFYRIMKIGTEERATGDQFQTVMQSIGDVFRFDEEIQNFFLSKLQHSPSLLAAIREYMFKDTETDIYINPHWQDWFDIS